MFKEAISVCSEIDLSYNNFTSAAKCRETLNLFKKRYSVHINCGGPAATIGKTTYEADDEKGGAAQYVSTGRDWLKSTTGHFQDVKSSSDSYIAQNMSILKMNNSVLYTEARLTPLSLTYYIVIRGNRSYYSLGRRVFDVYIQNIVVLKDFNIVKKAGGVDKVYIHNYKALVTNGALEIRLHWAGKGTTWSPEKGTYGPLISAIDVESGYLGGRKSRDRELVGLDLVTGIFTFRQIKTATNDFDAANKLGEGGFGCVYKGVLSDGTQIAVKQLSAKSKQGNREFVNEIGMISALQHPNLVRLYGCCIEGKQLLLVYEYMENNSLAHVLFGTKEIEAMKLDWPTRQRICVNIAKGLVFLHEESTLKIVHRDIKGTNILLDKDMNAKISDFGMAKLDDEDNTHIDTRIAGTMGYMAPEYALYGYLTYKADVYSFGVVALEIVSGMNNAKFRRGKNFVCLLDWVLYLQKNGDIMEMVDPRLGSAFNKKEVVRMINVALLCTNQSPTLRPIMSTVVSMLEGKTDVEELVMVPSTSSDQSGYATTSFNKFAQASFSGSSSETKSLVKSSEGPWTASSSSSAQDLYSVHIK
ncbi:LRR receptor serine/threonine-protein kinase [Salix suchowensis]|nr:LRR receptor serine/threonine-protein kinase [Salix suchowensis]